MGAADEEGLEGASEGEEGGGDEKVGEGDEAEGAGAQEARRGSGRRGGGQREPQEEPRAEELGWGWGGERGGGGGRRERRARSERGRARRWKEAGALWRTSGPTRGGAVRRGPGGASPSARPSCCGMGLTPAPDGPH